RLPGHLVPARARRGGASASGHLPSLSGGRGVHDHAPRVRSRHGRGHVPIAGGLPLSGAAAPGDPVPPRGRSLPRAAMVSWGVDADALSAAPLINFDRRDELQTGFLRSRGVSVVSPIHFVPASSEFAAAVRLGLGWGMLPDFQVGDALETGALIELVPGSAVT